MSFSVVPKKHKIQPSDVIEAVPSQTSNLFHSPKNCIQNGNDDNTDDTAAAPASLFTVLKFGGSSVGSASRLSHVLDVIAKSLIENPDRRLAIVVSAQGNTTDWLLDGADYASIGELDKAEQNINTIEETAITNAFAANSIPAKYSVKHLVKPLSGANDIVGTPLNCPTGTTPQLMPKGFVPQIRKLLEPLHKIMEGMSLLKERTPQGLDYALSFGERLSAFVLTNLLQARGIDSTYVDARSWLRTDQHFGNAKVDWEATKKNVNRIWQGWGTRVSVHTGFIGSSADGRTTTLGRNGSDYTATILGASLNAKEVVINTDVAGVMTADPRIVEDAVPVSNLTFDEALELAVYGTKLFHYRTFFPLMETDVPMLIRNTLGNMEGGTLISRNGGRNDDSSSGSVANDDVARPTCVTSLENLAIVEVRVLHQQESADANLGSLMSKTLADVGSTVYMESVAAHGHSVMFVIPQEQSVATIVALNKSLKVHVEQGEVTLPVVTSNVTMLSVVLESMRENPDVPATFLSALSALGISLLANTLGQRSYTCVIAGKDTKRAVRGVHSTFNLSQQVCSVVVVGAKQCKFGSSTTATSLVKMVTDEQMRLRKEMSLNLNLVGVTVSGTDRMLMNSKGSGIEAATAIELLSNPDPIQEKIQETVQNVVNTSTLDKMMETFKDLQNPILVDCSGNADHQLFYERCLAAGINVVVGNALSICSLQRQSSLLSQKNLGRGALLCYDTTVGGSLPVLSCIRSLQRSGDRVLAMQCALSGSVNSIACAISEGKTLSDAVMAAMENKFMELDPRVDLLGMDFARKVSMLSREVGFDLQVNDIEIVPFVAENVIGKVSKSDPMSEEEINDFTQSLKNHDANYNAYLNDNGCVLGKDFRLCYVATMKFDYNKMKVLAKITPTAIGVNSPLNRLRGKEVFVSLSTSMMGDSPFILSGAGQGGRSGASGLLGDVIRVAQRLRGRA